MFQEDPNNPKTSARFEIIHGEAFIDGSPCKKIVESALQKGIIKKPAERAPIQEQIADGSDSAGNDVEQGGDKPALS
jgi:hypothetical protein